MQRAWPITLVVLWLDELVLLEAPTGDDTEENRNGVEWWFGDAVICGIPQLPKVGGMNENPVAIEG